MLIKSKQRRQTFCTIPCPRCAGRVALSTTPCLIPYPRSCFPVAASDTVQVMHSQINLLRQTVLDLQQTEAQEMADLRRQIDDGAKARLDDFDSRLQAVEQQPRGGGIVRDSLHTV